MTAIRVGCGTLRGQYMVMAGFCGWKLILMHLSVSNSIRILLKWYDCVDEYSDDAPLLALLFVAHYRPLVGGRSYPLFSSSGASSSRE
jgi:hypothetical protein